VYDWAAEPEFLGTEQEMAGKSGSSSGNWWFVVDGSWFMDDGGSTLKIEHCALNIEYYEWLVAG